MNNQTDLLDTQIFDAYDDVMALPIGILLEVAHPDGNYWNGTRWVKTGDACWARISRELSSDEHLDDLVAARTNNISPCPSGVLRLVVSARNLAILATHALHLGRANSELTSINRRLRRMVVDARKALGWDDAA